MLYQGTRIPDASIRGSDAPKRQTWKGAYTELELDKTGAGWQKDWERVKRIAKTEHETKARALLQSQAEIVRLVGEFNLFYRTDDPEVEQMYRAAWMLTKGGTHGSAKRNDGRSQRG